MRRVYRSKGDRLFRIEASTLALLALVCATDVAAAIRVPADFPTIVLALQQAQPGDTVIVACGEYQEHHLPLHSGVTLLSESGHPDCVTIDGEYQGSILTCAGAAETVRVEGLTLTHGGGLFYASDNGGGLHAETGTVEIKGCRFAEDYAGTKGGGIYAYQASLLIDSCEFSENRGAGEVEVCGEGGAIYALDSQLNISDSWFSANEPDINCGGTGGALYCRGSNLAAIGCTFSENLSFQGGGAVYLISTNASFETTEFNENSGGLANNSISGESGGVILVDYCIFRKRAYSRAEISTSAATSLSISNSTFVPTGIPQDFSYLHASPGSVHLVSNSLFLLEDGLAVHDCYEAPSFTCCNIYSPAGDAWIDCYADQLGMNGNISADPQFCGIPGSDNYYLQSDSPCAPANNECGELIGALPVNCDAVSADATSISAIKALY